MNAPLMCDLCGQVRPCRCYDAQGRPLCPWCGVPLACLHWDLAGSEVPARSYN